MFVSLVGRMDAFVQGQSLLTGAGWQGAVSAPPSTQADQQMADLDIVHDTHVNTVEGIN